VSLSPFVGHCEALEEYVPRTMFLFHCHVPLCRDILPVSISTLYQKCVWWLVRTFRLKEVWITRALRLFRKSIIDSFLSACTWSEISHMFVSEYFPPGVLSHTAQNRGGLSGISKGSTSENNTHSSGMCSPQRHGFSLSASFQYSLFGSLFDMTGVRTLWCVALLIAGCEMRKRWVYHFRNAF
jgi:hypothetical protein